MTGRAVPTLAAGDLVLRPWSAADAPAVLRLADDPAARAWSASLRPVHTPEQARAWLAGRVGADRVHWAVSDSATGEVVGRVGLHRIDDEQRDAEIGYGVLAGRRRTGVARQAVEAALRHAFGGLGLARVSLRHAVGNQASCAVARACGFTLEGVERSALDHGDGVRHDAHLHARLATDPNGPLPPPPVPVEPVEVVAGALQLRPWERRHASAVVAASADPVIRQWNDPRVADPEAARAWVDRARDWGTHATWAVHDVTTGDVLGNVSLHRVEPEHARGEVGYWVLPQARGRGVASTAVAAATRFAFGALGLQRVELIHAIDNPASCRVAEKAGFLREGLLRSAYRYGDGRLHDDHLHARLATDPEPG